MQFYAIKKLRITVFLKKNLNQSYLMYIHGKKYWILCKQGQKVVHKNVS